MTYKNKTAIIIILYLFILLLFLNSCTDSGGGIDSLLDSSATLSLTIEGQGAVKINGKLIEDKFVKDYKLNEIVELEAIAEEGWFFGKWGYNLSGNMESRVIVMEDDINVVALFTDAVKVANSKELIEAARNPSVMAIQFTEDISLNDNLIIANSLKIFYQEDYSLNLANNHMELRDELVIRDGELNANDYINILSNDTRNILSFKDIIIRNDLQINNSQLILNKRITGIEENKIISTDSSILIGEYESQTRLINLQLDSSGININENTVMINGGWTEQSTVRVSDGKILKVEAGSNSKVQNDGHLILGDTGKIDFNNNMLIDLENPLYIDLSLFENNIIINTNYGRNISYADNNREELQQPETYFNLGANQSNLKYKVNKIAANIEHLDYLEFEFDGNYSLQILPEGDKEQLDENITLTVKDKYINDNITDSIEFNIGQIKEIIDDPDDDDDDIPDQPGNAVQISEFQSASEQMVQNITTIVTATVVDNDLQPVPDVIVYFSSDNHDKATVEEIAVTDEYGQARAIITGADNQTGDVTITASIYQDDDNVSVSDQKSLTIEILEKVIDDLDSGVIRTSDSIVKADEENINLEIELKDINGLPITGFYDLKVTGEIHNDDNDWYNQTTYFNSEGKSNINFSITETSDFENIKAAVKVEGGWLEIDTFNVTVIPGDLDPDSINLDPPQEEVMAGRDNIQLRLSPFMDSYDNYLNEDQINFNIRISNETTADWFEGPIDHNNIINDQIIVYISVLQEGNYHDVLTEIEVDGQWRPIDTFNIDVYPSQIDSSESVVELISEKELLEDEEIELRISLKDEHGNIVSGEYYLEIIAEIGGETDTWLDDPYIFGSGGSESISFTIKDNVNKPGEYEDAAIFVDGLIIGTIDLNIIELYEIEMIEVVGGVFEMGGEEDENDIEGPIHSVELDDFYISETPITQYQYEQITGENPSEFTPDNHPEISGESKNRPVENISWWEAIEFCNQLSRNAGLPVAYAEKGEENAGQLLDGDGNVTTDVTEVEGFRLPTEAEWEYAARGGNKAEDTDFAGSNDLKEVGWYLRNSDQANTEYEDPDDSDTSGHGTMPVKEKTANELGLYDMSGNVREWVTDYWSTYDSESKENPYVYDSGILGHKVFRGGHWGYSYKKNEESHSSDTCRVSYRRNAARENQDTESAGIFGFRITLSK